MWNAVYFLAPEIADDKRQVQVRWLESTILRRSGDRWLLALLHSTRIGRRSLLRELGATEG